MDLTGAELARHYYEQVVRPLLAERWPDLPHAAGRLGSDSDVLGLDDATSRDHDWGLRLNLLVPADAVSAVDDALAEGLPAHWAGHATRFATTWDPVVVTPKVLDCQVNRWFGAHSVSSHVARGIRGCSMT